MTIIEQPTTAGLNRAGKSSTYELRFHVRGAANTTAALAELLAASVSIIPLSVSVDGYSLTNRRYKCDAKGKGDYIFEGVVSYSHEESAENTRENPVIETTGDIESTIDFSLTKKHITTAPTVSSEVDTDYTGLATDIGDNINWDFETGQAMGADIDVATSMLNYTILLPAATVTESWINTREELLGQVNDATFKGRALETCRFVRMQLRQRSKAGNVHVTFGIERSRTYVLALATLNIKGITGNKTIYPFRLYDLLRIEIPNTANTFMIPKAIAFLERRPDEIQPADFSILGI